MAHGFRALALLVCLVTILLGQGAVEAQEVKDREDIEFSAQTSVEKVELFAASFKEAVRERSCFKLADLTRFPLRLNYGHRQTRWLWNRTALCRYFPQIFTPGISKIVLEQEALDPVGWRGLMFGNGAIWIQPVDVEPPPGSEEPSTRLVFVAANLETLRPPGEERPPAAGVLKPNRK
jgi:hypothetical protein